MMLRITSFEFCYLIKSLPSITTFALLFGIGFLLTANGSEFQATAVGGDIYANAPSKITKILIMISVFSVFVAPSFLANSALKDFNHKFEGILFSTPIDKKSYFCGRFFGAFLALLVAFFGAPLGMLLGEFWPWADPSTLATTHVSYYLIVYFGFIAPSLLVIASLIFSVALLSGKIIYTYLTGVAVLFMYAISSESNIISPLLDPFMHEVFEQSIKYWTVTELNNQLIHYSGMVLMNRVLWVGLAVLLLIFAFKRYSFRLGNKSIKTDNPQASVETADHTSLTTQSFFTTQPQWGGATTYAQFILRMKFEFFSVMKSLPFILLISLSVLMLIFSLLGQEVRYGVQPYPITRLMIGALMSSFLLAILVILVFYSADIVWREREGKLNEIMDAVPTPNWVFVVSKLMAILLVLLSVIIVGILIALIIQVTNGYYNFELSMYIQRGIFYPLLPFIFMAVLAVFFQVLARNRYIGILLFGIFLSVIVGSNDIFGWRHPLFSYAIPDIEAPLSDMNGNGRFITAGLVLRLYWGCIAGLLLMLTYMLWNRGTNQPLKYRLRNIKNFNTKTFRNTFIVLFGGCIVTGSIIFFNTNVLNTYASEEQKDRFRVNYEKLFRAHSTLPMPRVIDVKIDVDIFPFKRRVETHSKHILLNQTEQQIETIHMTFPYSTEVPMVQLEKATLESINEEFKYYIFNLDKPMLPGEKRELEFRTIIQQHGFVSENPDVSLVRNGTFIRNNRIVPTIGFNTNYLLRDKKKRQQYGMPPLASIAPLHDISQHSTNGIRHDSDFIHFETTVSTVKTQTALSPGFLVKQWTQDDRNYFTYKMNVPMMNFYAFLSAEYSHIQDQWQGIDIHIFHHKPHTHNIKRMIEGIKDSFAYFSEVFSPYQYPQVSIIEFPAYREFAQSFATAIPYSEGIGFVADVKEQDIDMPYYVTAHEIAHQWWGHQVNAADVQGNAFIIETLSQYSALLVMERKYGKNQIRKFLKYELDEYLKGRSEDAEGELPLYKVEKQPYIYYRKGAVIMYALKDYLGEEVINKSLRQLIKLRAYSSSPYAISSDFINILKENAQAEYIGFIEDSLEKITLYDLELIKSDLTELTDGRFKITVQVKARKYHANAQGIETESTLNLPIDIGLFEQHPAEYESLNTSVIQLTKHTIGQGLSSLEIIVDKKPKFVGIDPYHKLIDRAPDNNIKKVDF